MAASSGYILAHLQRWTAPHRAEQSDAVLLEEFLQRRDQSAFAALVARYGNMVLRSCRRVLGDGHEAEDAFQAAFLILARKAHTLKQPAALPGFLHSIARHVALKARRSVRRKTVETAVPTCLADPHPDPLAQLTARELLTVLEEEVAHLPLPQRSAVLLCCLEGRTQEEAARLLGWSAGSLKGHLERGRRRLQDRLRRRGIALSAALAIVAVARGDAVSASLIRNTMVALSGGIGNTAAALAHSVLRTMILRKLAAVMTVLLTVALAASASVAFVLCGPFAPTAEDKSPPLSSARKADTGKPQSRTDSYGDPLPDGVLRRLGTLRFRHGGSIRNLLLTPDGKTLVSNDYYGTRTVCVWDVASGKLRRRLPGTFDERNISLSPDGKLVAICQNEAVFLWDLASGKEVRRIAQSNVSGTAFSPDGKLLAAAGQEPDIHLWDLATGKSIARWPWQRDPTSTVLLAFTPDGKTLIAGQQFDSKIVLWDTASGKKRSDLDTKTGHIFTFVLSPDGARLATGSRTGGASLWDVKTGKLLHRLQVEGGKECTAVAFSPNGKILAAIQRDGKNQDYLNLWDVADGKELHQIKDDGGFWNVLFSRDGKSLIVASNGAIRLLDAATGKEFGPTAGTPPYTGFATMSPDGRTLAYSRNDEVRLWDMRAGREIGSLDASPHGLLSLAFAPDGRTVAAGVGEYAIRLWDMNTRKVIHRMQWDKKENPRGWWARGIAFSPDGRLLASGEYASCVVRFWEAATGKQASQLRLSDEAKDFMTIEGVAFSPDGKTLAVSGRGASAAGVSDSSRVRLWNVATGKQLTHLNARLNDPADKGPHSLNHPRGPIVEPKIQFSPDGRMLALNRWQKTIPVWEAATGRQRLLLQGPEASTVCVAFAPDGRTLASASWDNSICLWDLDTGRELRKLTGHRGKANSLAFSADGTILVSAGDDTTILFWDVADVTQRKRPHASPLAAKEWQSLWEELAEDDAATAYAAMIRLAAAGPTAIAAMRKQLHPIRPVEPERLARLLKELDSDDFAVREAAQRELEKLGDAALPTVRQTLAGAGLSLELRRRLEGIAAALDELSGERLRQLRAVEILEWIGATEARELLKTVAAGAAEARLTEQARAALVRLAKTVRE